MPTDERPTTRLTVMGEDKPAMTDPAISQDAREIVDRLRKAAYWKSSDGYTEEYNRLPYDAADIIEAHLRTPATDTEALQQRVERLEVALRVIGQSAPPVDHASPLREQLEWAKATARAALGDDVG